MRDCKKYQSMIKDFDRGRLACSDEEEFVNHIEQCNDCKEEFEIYYIVEYGLNDDMDNIPIKKEYRELLEKYDFKGLIGAKIKDSRNNIEAVKKKYKEYEEIQCIHICVDEVVDTGDLKLSDKDFNYNTLEPKILKENGREAMNNIFGTNYDTDDEMHKYMHAHKTDCAIAIFESATKIKYPEYIMRAIKNE